MNAASYPPAFLHAGRQFLARRARASKALDVVGRVVALQAQIPTVPALALAARVDRLPADLVRRALDVDKTLLRGWCLRGTLHVFRTEDLPLLRGALGAGLAAYAESVMKRFFGLGPREVRAQDRRILRALERGPMTRAEIERATGLRLRHWNIEIRHLAHRGLVVHAGQRGAEAVFDLLPRFAPNAPPEVIPREEARRRLLLRYLAGYGPATPRDFAFWLGTTQQDVRSAFEAARPEIVEQEDGTFRLRFEPPTRRLSEDVPPRLLPRFDVYVLSHRDKSRFLDPRHRTKVFRPAAVVEAVFLVNGRVAGTWTHRPSFRLRPFAALSPPVRAALHDEFSRLRPFFP